MRRLPPSNEPDSKKTITALVAPRAIGLVLGLLLGYLLFPGPAGEPAAAPVVASAR